MKNLKNIINSYIEITLHKRYYGKICIIFVSYIFDIGSFFDSLSRMMWHNMPTKYVLQNKLYHNIYTSYE